MAVTLFAGAETVATGPLFPPPFDKVAHFTYYGSWPDVAHGLGLRWLIVPLIWCPSSVQPTNGTSPSSSGGMRRIGTGCGLNRDHFRGILYWKGENGRDTDR